MSQSKALLHGPELLTALTETAVEVQRCQNLEEALVVAARGFEAFGAGVAVVSRGRVARLRYLTARSDLEQLKTLALDGQDELRAMPEFNAESTEPQMVDGLRALITQFLTAAGAAGLVDVASVPDRCIVSSLRTHSGPWGGLIVMHDGLRDEDAGAFRLFALQLGSAIEICEGLERLERRIEELNLVHELAVAGPRTDSRELCRRALEMVCMTSESEVGGLHRYDDESGEYVLVGDVHGHVGPLVEMYKRFKIPASNPIDRRPMALSSAQLPADSKEVLAEGLLHFAIVPLQIEGKAIGLLSLARRRDVPYTRAALRSAEILGVQMASLLERARLYDESNRLYGDLKTSYDQLERAQQELVRHERLAALGELAAVMAHEVRNPLGVIFNSLTTLKRLLRPTGDAEMLLNMVGEEADRLNRIVGDLLDFVRPYELVKKQIAVEPVISGAVDSATQSSLQNNVRVVTEFPRELPPFPLDAHLLKQALVNLIVNAAQAMPKGGTVTVRAQVEVEPGGPWLVIRVRDEGVGLSERASAKMFQPFFTTKATGTGLGLAVVKRIVDAHLGEVTARSNDDGKGTTFVVRFPPTTETRSGALTPPRPSPSVPRSPSRKEG